MKANRFTKFIALIATLATALICATGCQKKIKDPYENEADLIDLSVRDVVCDNGCVAAANPYAAHAGLEVLMNGGNAFDAAVAVSFALGLVEPHCSGVAGGGILVGYNATTEEFVSYNFREVVPGAGKASAYSAAEEMDEGIRSAGVPTIVQSLLGIMDEQGNFNNDAEGRKKVIQPTINYATNGFTVTKELASAISSQPSAWNGSKKHLPADYVGDADTFDEQAREIFSDDGLPLEEGNKMYNQNLAKVLQEIVDKGSDGFYKGWVAEAMLEAQQDYKANGSNNRGLWTAEDFAYVQENYPKQVNPVKGTYKGYDIISATCPSSGGIIMLEALNMLETYCKDDPDALKNLGHNSAEYINLMSTVTQLAYGDKQKYIGDSSINPADGKPFTDVPVKGLLNKEYAAHRLQENYRVGKAFNGKHTQARTTETGGTVSGQNYGNPWKYCDAGEYRSEVGKARVHAEYTPEEEEFEERNPSADTTAFSCADKYGNIVSITQTINHFFGAKLMPKGCGFYLNNQLSSFSLSTSSASYVKPYKHPTSHIMPTIILKDGEPVATLGSPGSMRLVTAVFTTVVNMIDWGMNIQDAIEAARIYSYCVSTSDNGAGEGTGDESQKALYIEQTDEITAETAMALREMGYGINVYGSKNLFFGGVQGITFENGKMHGGADIRRDGKALGF